MRHLSTELVTVLIAGALITLIVSGRAARDASPSARDAPPRPRTLRALYGLEPAAQLAPSRTALVLVDFQDEFFHGRLPLPQGPSAASHAAALLTWARRAGVTVVHVRNQASRLDSPVFAPGSPTTRFVPALEPRDGELVITKAVLGAFSRTQLHPELQARRIDTLIVAGLMTHLAVQATASDATMLGYRTIVAADAVATRALPGAAGQPDVDAQTVQRASLAILADRVADVLPNRSILALPLDRQ